MAHGDFVPTDAFDHRYASVDALRDILQKPPLSFKAKDILIRASQGRGFGVKLPRKLTSDEKDQVIEALNNVHESTQQDEQS